MLRPSRIQPGPHTLILCSAWPWAILCLLLAAPAWPQELYLLGGYIQHAQPREDSYAWMLGYSQGMGEHAALSFGWINEGHVSGHHRDGHVTQLWARTHLLDRRLSLRAGIGPYYYFDTAVSNIGGSYEDTHGWGVIASLASVWYGHSPWLIQARTNYINLEGGINTVSWMIGLGYQFGTPQKPGPLPMSPHQNEDTTDREVTVFLGQTIVNSFGSEKGVAQSVEYRQGIGPHLDWTVAWIEEGDAALIRRNGIATQLWLTRAFLNDRLTLGFGGGGYFSIDKYRSLQPGEEGDETLAGLVTISGSWRFGPRWLSRVSWNRVVTNYNRDTDILLLGLGYRL